MLSIILVVTQVIQVEDHRSTLYSRVRLLVYWDAYLFILTSNREEGE